MNAAPGQKRRAASASRYAGLQWSFTGGRLTTPKNHERRDVDLTPDLVETLGAWWGELGRPEDDKLVFPGETKSGYLNSKTVLYRELYPAMEAAEIPRTGPTGEKRTFHSLRPYVRQTRP